MKKIVSMILIVSLIILSLPMSALAQTVDISQTSLVSGDFEYEILDDGTAEITAYNGSVTNLMIPDTLDGYTVTAIGYCAFAYEYHLGPTSITLPDSVTTIGYGAFRYTDLTEIIIPDSVKYIGPYAFESCVKLIEIKLPNNIKVISEGTFASCRNLASITISDSITDVWPVAFKDCSSLTSITIPDSVTLISDEAFNGCESLTSVTIPDSITRIGYGIFSNCSSLDSIKVDSNNKVYDSRNNCNAIINTKKNTLVAGCKNTVIPDSVTSIGYGAFSYCTSLISLTIPDSITSIGLYAFKDCSSLTSITIPDSVTLISDEAFNGCESLTSVIIPDSVTSIGNRAFYSCDALTVLVYQNSRAHKYAINNDIPYIILTKLDTDEAYLFLAKNYPEYLDNERENAYLRNCASNCYDVIEQYSDTHIGILAFAESFVNGTSIIVKELFASIGLAQSTQEEWLEKNAMTYLRELQACEDVVYDNWKKVEEKYKDFKFVVKGIDLTDTVVLDAQKTKFIKSIDTRTSILSEDEIETLADSILKKQPNGIKKFFDTADYVVDAADLLLYSCQMLEVEVATLETLKENISTTSPLYEAICDNLSTIKDDPTKWVLDKYLNEQCLEVVTDLLDDFVDWSAGVITTGTDLSLTSKVVRTISTLIYDYVYQGPKIDELYGAIVAYDFYTTVSSGRDNLLTDMIQCKMNGSLPSDELIDDYRFMFEAKRVALSNYAQACININKNEGKESILMTIKEDTQPDGLLGFDKYIEICMEDFVKDVNSGKVSCNHKLYTKSSVVNATCTIQGYDACKCNACGVSFNTNYTSALGHNYSTTTIGATCTQRGYTKHSCIRCSYSYNDSYIDAKGHSYTSKVTTPATCTANGVRTYTCSTCKNSYTETVLSIGHTEVVDKGYEATYGKDGLTDGSHCSVCGKVLVKQIIIPALDFKVGDANQDGHINIVDATTIQRHLAQLTSLEGNALLAADANGDGRVTIVDATHIQRFLAQLIPHL